MKCLITVQVLHLKEKYMCVSLVPYFYKTPKLILAIATTGTLMRVCFQITKIIAL